MSALLQFWWTLGGGVYAADSRRGSILLGAAVGEIYVSRVQVGVGDRVAESPSLGPAQEEEPHSLDNTNLHNEPQDI